MEKLEFIQGHTGQGFHPNKQTVEFPGSLAHPLFLPTLYNAVAGNSSGDSERGAENLKIKTATFK